VKHATVFTLLVLVVAGMAINASELRNVAQSDAGIEEFWEKFRDAVIKGDKPTVARLSRFPISMPYGIASVKNRAQLIRRYRDVFNHDGSSASDCFATAKPVTDPGRPKEFTVGCKNLAGDEVIIYTFRRTPAGWRFALLDNINE
jgi:hypothetical protein